MNLESFKKFLNNAKSPLTKVEPVKVTFVEGLDKPDFLIIPKNGLTMIAGTGGVGKSFIALHLAIRYAIANPEKKVLLWLSEDPKGITAGRFKATWFSYYQSKFKEKYGAINNIDIVGNDTGVHSIDELNSKEIKELFDGYDFIVLDPLISLAPTIETDAQTARTFMNRLFFVAKDKDAIVVIHHVSKTTAEAVASASDPTDLYISGRGSSDITNATRVTYLVYKPSAKKEENAEGIDIDLDTQRKAVLAKDNWGVRTIIGTDTLTLTIFPPASKSKSKSSK